MTMNCDQARTLLGAYADGELSALEREALQKHLDRCGRCRAIVADQQRVERVLKSYGPPPVAPERWSAMGRRLAAVAEGREQADLATRMRTEPFEAEDEEPAGRTEAPPPAPALPRPVVHRPGASPAPSALVLPRAVRRRPRWRWLAHAAGLLAAAALVGGAFWTARLETDFQVGPESLATQADVTIHGIQMLDPGYTVVLYAGAPDDMAAVWVEPSENEG